MPIVDDKWDTANNREAETRSSDRQFGARAAIDISNMIDAVPSDDVGRPVDDSDSAATVSDSADRFDRQTMHRLMVAAYQQGSEYQRNTLHGRWRAAYQAFNNEHVEDSKYRTTRFRGRSSLYRPKTRSATRKKMAEAASALFTTSDVVQIEPGDPSDQMQAASAAILRQVMNHRLSSASENAAIPWFLVALGAHLTALQTGICASKQYWELKRIQVGTETVEEPVAHPYMPGEIIGTQTVERPVIETVRNRPVIRLFPPEDVIRDPSGAWHDQAQDSSYVILRHQMTVDEAHQFVDAPQGEGAGGGSPLVFDDGAKNLIAQAAGRSEADSSGQSAVRRARDNSGTDRMTDNASTANEYRNVWLHENFFRVGGEEYVFWSVENTHIVSNVARVRDVYPEQNGARPITIGIGALEPFKIDPTSAIFSWRPLQQEINDVVNLRLDAMKQTIAPLAMVRRGRSIDIKAIQNRSPDSVVYVQESGDLEFDRPGEVSQSSYLEMEKLNADFDEQAGNFSTGSVQTNRTLGETVGGMNLMSSNANIMGEFDLRVWVESWVEPTLRQVVKLEQYYETDAAILGLCRSKAQLFQRFGVDAVTDELLEQFVTVRVDVGMGSADPQVKLQKFSNAAMTVAQVVASPMGQMMKLPEFVDEVFGICGYQNAFERFFLPEASEDPRVMQMQQQMDQMMQALQQADMQSQDKAADRQSRESIAKLNAKAKMASQEMQLRHDDMKQKRDAILGIGGKAMDMENAAEAGEMEELRQPQPAQAPAAATGAIEKAIAAQATATQNLAAAVEAMGKTIAQAMSAPKKLVTGPDGSKMAILAR